MRFGAGILLGVVVGVVAAGGLGLAMAGGPGGSFDWTMSHMQRGHHADMHEQMHGGSAACENCYSPTADGGAAVRVEMQDSQFHPREVRIEAGQSVEWINLDSYAHTVTANDGSFDSGSIPGGQAWTMRFDEPGVYEYHCTPHSGRQSDGTYRGMVGTVVVEAA